MDSNSPISLNPNIFSPAVKDLDDYLKAKVIGQDTAVDSIVSTYQHYLAGFHDSSKPVGNFLFLGPTGVGKTLLVETLAQKLSGRPDGLIKIDCAEFQHSHEIAKLIGSPPGYLGHRETHPLLSQENLNKSVSETNKLTFVLFDEIEKSSDALWKLLLGVLDKATLTLGDNRRVNFASSLIFMTSNLGARQMMETFTAKFGFGIIQKSAVDAPKLEKIALAATKRKFSPEFFNRLDMENIVVFRPLTQEQMNLILDLELKKLQDRIVQANVKQPVFLTVSPAAKALLLKEGFSPEYGARPLMRAIRSRLAKPLAMIVSSGQLKGNAFVTVDCQGNELTFAAEKMFNAA